MNLIFVLEPVDSNRFHDLADELSHEERLDEKARKLTHNPDEIVKLDAGVKSIIKNYGQLKAKVNKNILAPETGDFKEARVEELWKQALQAGFDRDELLSLRVREWHGCRPASGISLAWLFPFNFGIVSRLEI